MRKTIIGTFSFILGTILILDSLPGITGHVISGQTNLNFIVTFGLVFLICGIALFVLEAREKLKK